MFSQTVQPSLVSLFSSSNSDPLQLFSRHSDSNRQDESFIHLLLDEVSTSSTTQQPKRFVQPPCLPSFSEVDLEDRDTLKHSESRGQGRLLCQTVLHIQSPNLPSTYICCPPLRNTRLKSTAPELGLTLPCMHMQVRTLGREWTFECGIADRAGRKGVIRFSTFKVRFLLRLFPDEAETHLLQRVERSFIESLP